MKYPSVTQKSTADGSQRAPGVNVIVGVMEGTMVGDVAVVVGISLVFVATTGASVTCAFPQDARTSSRRELSSCFIQISRGRQVQSTLQFSREYIPPARIA